MTRLLTILTAFVLLTGLAAASARAQGNPIPDALQARALPRQHLSGPRFGFTTFTGDIAKLRESVGKQVVMSQFGWQFETQIVSTRSGNQALMEWVALLGGVEQDEANLSLSWLAGYRLPSGVEFGAGPNVSVRKGGADPTTSMVIAAGVTLPLGDLRTPVNVAVAFAEGGPRFTTLIGWVIG